MSAGENRYYGGLCRFDMSEKPAYKVLKNLVNKEWHTSASLKAINGKVKFRGFYGDYKLKIFAGDKEMPLDFKLSEGKTNEITINL